MKKYRKRRPTMTEVAKLAGVSQTTVSFVINGNSDIPNETKERIMDAISELGYRPNRAAQILRTDHSGIIGFVTDEIAITPYAGKIFEGAQDVAWAQNKILLLVNTKNDPRLEVAAINMLQDQRVEGIIYAAMYHRRVTPPDLLWEIPSVLLDCYVADRSLPAVFPDEVGAGYQATSILLDQGHKRIGFMNSNNNASAGTAGRLKGYQDALAAYGIPYDDALVCIDVPFAEGGYRCTKLLMQRPNPPTALFCYCDRMAMGAYDALRNLKVSIPEDVAVMGFDNQEIIAAHLYPPLSTMELPHYEMGKWATQFLLEHINHDGDIHPVQNAQACSYIKRLSV